MAANNILIVNNAGNATGRTFTQQRTENNNNATGTRGVLKPCFKPGCALNCKHKAAACFKASAQQAC